MATQTTSLPDGSTLTKPEYTDPADIAEINSNMDKIVNNINKGNTDVVQLSDGLAIVANGNTHAAISSGQFVYVRNHGTLSDGLYKASTAISTNEALSTSNLTPDGSGGLNALKGDIDALNSNFAPVKAKTDRMSYTPFIYRVETGNHATMTITKRNSGYDWLFLTGSLANSPGDATIFWPAAGGTAKLYDGNSRIDSATNSSDGKTLTVVFKAVYSDGIILTNCATIENITYS